MRLVWLTDIHLNFVSAARKDRMFDEICDAKPDAVLLGGDIAEADSFAGCLKEMAERIGVPVYFVLGNHDYYRGSIEDVRRVARELTRDCDLLHWLPDVGAVPITEDVSLVGHGGWGDGRTGSFLDSEIMLNDYFLIRELREANGAGRVLTPSLLDKLNALGDEAAEYFRTVLPSALERSREVFVLMHVPPFLEACWHDGKLSDANWSPHFTCKAAGDALLELSEQFPECRVTVLCGHTHSEGEAVVGENLQVLTGRAEYGAPGLQRVFDVE